MPLTLLVAMAVAGLSGSGFVIWRFQAESPQPLPNVPAAADMMPLTFGPQQGGVGTKISIPLATLSGVQQLPIHEQERLQSELATIDTLAAGLKFVRQVHAAYRGANLPRPVVSLRLPAPGRPHLAVNVTESAMQMSAGRGLAAYARSDKPPAQEIRAPVQTPSPTTVADAPPAKPAKVPQMKTKSDAKAIPKDAPKDAPKITTTEPPATAATPPPKAKAARSADIPPPKETATPAPPASDKAARPPTVAAIPTPATVTEDVPPAPTDASWQAFYEMQDAEAPAGDFLTMDDIPEDQQLWLELVVDGQRRLDVFTAMQLPGGKVLLPLQAIIEAIGFPIEVNPAAGTADGWFVTEEQTFQLDAAAKQVRVGGAPQPWPADLRIFSTDIYVPMKDFAAWFPLKFNLAFNQLTLYAESTMTLPEKARMERRQTWQERAAQLEKKRQEIDPENILPYQNFAFPHVQIDQQSNASINGETNETSWSQRTGLQAEGDVLGFGGQFTAQVAQADDEKIHLDRATVRLSRQSAEGKLLGPLAATQLELGDIDLPNLALAGGGNGGRGAYFTNTPTGYVSDINTFELTGEGTVGWDIEVYQSGFLKAFGVVPDDGRFRFTDLTLQPGLNIFRILLFGPEGQREERVQRFYLGPNMVNTGQFYYEAGVTESNLAVIPTGESEKLAPAAVFRGTYGLNRYISLQGGLRQGQLHNEDDTVGVAGLQFGYAQIFGQLNMAESLNQGRALDARLQAQLAPNTSVGGEWTTYNGRWAEEENIKHRIGLDARRTFHLWTPVDIDIDYTREIDPQSRTLHNLELTQGLRLWDFSLENSLEHEWDANNARTIGTFQFATQRWQFPLRGSVRYQPGTANSLQNASLNGQFNLEQNTNLNLQLTHDFTGSNITRISGSLNTPVGKTTLRLNGGIDTVGTASVGVGMSFHFVPALNTDNNWLPAYTVQPRNRGFGFGSVKVRTFIDTNNNQQFDEGETLVPDVVIRNSRNGREVTTLATGTGMLYGLSPFQGNTLQIEKSELPDIYLRPVVAEKNIVPHRGFSGTIDFPFAQMGEIAGMVISQQGDKLQPQANIPLELYNEAGKKVDDIFSAYDGFFLFPAIPTGTYNIRLPAEAEDILGFKLAAPVSITLTPENPLPDEINIILEQTNTKNTETPADMPASVNTASTTTIY